jgi:hypothetical protein
MRLCLDGLGRLASNSFELDREVIIAHRSPLTLATYVRSTLLQSSLAFLRERGHYQRYLAQVSSTHRETIVGSLAPVWLPIEAGVAHYRACDALQLDHKELVAIGEAVGDRIQGTFMKTLVQTARAAGATPWVLFKRFDRMWDRLFQGGSVEVVRVGPKDLTVEVAGAQLPQFEYFRTAFTGVVRAGFKFVGVRASYVHQSPWDARLDRFVMRAAWV